MKSALKSRLFTFKKQSFSGKKSHFKKHFEKFNLALWFVQLVLSYIVALS